MNVAFFGQSGPLAGIGLATLISHLPGEARLALVVEAAGHKRAPSSGWLRGLAQPRSAARGPVPHFDLELAARRLGVRYLWCRAGDDARTAAELTRQRIELGLTLGFPHRLSARLRRASGAVLNAHPSALPAFRGPSPLFWWLRSGAPSTAVTVHLMDEGLDTGPILLQRPLLVPAITRGDVLLRLAGEAGALALAEVARRWLRGYRTGASQPPVGTTPWARRPRLADAFIVPRTWPARALARFLAAAPHFVAPSFVLGGQRFFVSGDGELPTWQEGGMKLPGDFVQQGVRIHVATRDGLVACSLQR